MALALVLGLILTLPTAADGADRDIAVRQAGSSNQVVFLHGEEAEAMSLHSTANPVSELRLVEPAGIQVIFASWLEAGREMVTVSPDGGATWSRVREMRREIPLRSRTIDTSVPASDSDGANSKSPANKIYIVQFRTQSLSELRHRLRSLGAEVLSFIPFDAHLVRMDSDVAEAIRRESFVRWVGPYSASLRLAKDLLARIAGGDEEKHRYILQTFTSGIDEKASLASEVAGVGGSIVLQTPNGYLLEALLTGSQALEILDSDHLQWMELWTPPEDDMDIGRIVSGADDIESVGGYDGTGVRGEVMDGNVEQGHQDFDGILIHGPTPAGDASHGTSTFGIVFGNGDRDGDGNAQATGMLPAAQGYFADYGELTDRYQHTSELVQSPIEAVFQSNSWGSSRTLHYTSRSAEMDDIVWQYDIPIFQSQSNSGDQYSRPQAWAKNVISIGAVNHYNDTNPANDCWCDTASIGPAADGRIKPDLNFFYDSIFTTTVGNSYRTNFGGTSGATPMAAGAAGLVLQMWADNIYGNSPPGASVFERRPHHTTLKAILVNTAEQYPFAGMADDLARVRQGWGAPNVREVLDRATLTRIIDESSVLRELEFDAYTATVEPGQPSLEISMVYADRAAVPGALIHRVNDVSLRVVAPDGTEYWGNHGLHDSPWSTAGGAPDTLNTVENVFIEAPQPGVWIVEVHAAEVNMDVHGETPEDDQDYAMVVYGVTSLNECSSSIPTPTSVTATPAGDNQITINWSGSASGYQVWRSEGGCGGPPELIATPAGPPFIDTVVPGGVTHGYTVRAVDGCSSPDSACVEAATTGECQLTPSFQGAQWSVGRPNANCGIELQWDQGTDRCGGTTVYNVYRSTDPAFVPGPSNRVAQCLTELTWIDTSGLDEDLTYHYIVRGEGTASTGAGPCGGVEDGNTVRRSLTPTTLLLAGFESGLDRWSPTECLDGITGEFVVDSPRATFSSGRPAQPGQAAVGNQCLFTARNPNGNPGKADVDDGEVVVFSPLFDASQMARLELSLWRWFHVPINNSDAQDYFAIDVSQYGGGLWTNVETLDRFATDANAWTEVSYSLETLVPLTDTMRLRIRASDGASIGAIIEAAVDEVHIFGPNACASTAIFSDGFETGDTARWSQTVP